MMLPSPLPNKFGEVFLINGPRWSLFFEDAVNIAMVLSWRFFRSTPRLIVACLLMGIALALSMRHFHTYEIGWSAETFAAGFLRVGFPFSAGILIYRLRRTGQRVSRLALLLPFLLVPLFLLDPARLVVYGLLCIGVAFPLLVWAGARYQPPSARLCRFLGDVSYPLYVIHVPLFGLAEWALWMTGRTPASAGPLAGLLLLALAIGASWLLARTYDPAARRWLGSKLLRSAEGRGAAPSCVTAAP
jgi:peptidoglycan/LPS O-acetylase OafA/YrhL